MGACEHEDVDPTWGPLQDEEYKTPPKPDVNCRLHRAEMTTGSCPLYRSQRESHWWCPAGLRGELPSAQPPDSSVLGFPSSPLILESLKTSYHEEGGPKRLEVQVIDKRGWRREKAGKEGEKEKKRGMGGEAKREGREGRGRLTDHHSN